MSRNLKCVRAIACFAFVGYAASPVLAVIETQVFVSDNNKLYYVVASDSSPGSVGTQVTSLVMASGTAVSVDETNPFFPSNPDTVVTAFSTFLTGSFLDPPVSNLQRTGIITGLSSNHIENMGNPLNGVFDPTANGGDGLLTLPGNTKTVSFSGGTETVVSASATTGSGDTFVPAAATTNITRRVGNTTFTNVPTMVFPNPAGPPVISAGSTCVLGTNPGTACDPANGMTDTCTGGGTCTNFGGLVVGQNVTLDNGIGARVGSPPSQGNAVDGFLLPASNAIIVFMVDDGAPSFGVAASGFDVTGTCSNKFTPCAVDGDCQGGTCGFGLPQRNVLHTAGNLANQNFNTPTGTPPTATATPQQTRTPTATPIQVCELCTPTATPKPGHGPLSASSHAAPVADCIAKCRSLASTLGDFLICQAFCPRGKPPTPTPTGIPG